MTPLRFIASGDAQVEESPWGPHEWISRPGLTEAAGLLMVRVTMPPGAAHRFHQHPELEEILYVVSGTAEQWVDREMRLLNPGNSAHIPPGTVHATHNAGSGPLVFLAILSPAACSGPMLVDMHREEPWASLRPPR